MKDKTLLNKVRELLGMEVKLEQRKLEDGVTIIEADEFEAGAEVMIITEDEQKIPLPVGEYVMEGGEQVLVVTEEGVISEVKAKEEEVEEEAKKDYEEKEDEKEEEMTDVKPAKKVVESIVKETHFSEIEALKKENEELKAQIEKLSKSEETTETVTEEVTEEKQELSEDLEPAEERISYNPENVIKNQGYKFSQNRTETTLDRVFKKLNK
jgi:putative cell wall-binding protein